MSTQFDAFKQWLNRLSQMLDRSLFLFATYAMPVVIGLLSLLAMFFWSNQFPVSKSQQLEIQAAPDPTGTMTPAQALSQLQGRPPNPNYDTRLSESPVWLAVLAPVSDAHTPLSIEFPSRHAMDIACWDGTTLSPLGRGDRRAMTGGISLVQAGFALDLQPSSSKLQILCRITAIGPARLTANVWRTSDLQISEKQFYRSSSLLDGGLLTLAAFVLVTALINRSHLYLLFAVWLVANLRMGSLSAGWDTQWLGHVVPLDWLTQIRATTIALYYVLTLTLFTTLFKDDLSRVGYRSLVRVAQWSCIPLLVLSFLLPYASFLPLVWSNAGVGIGMLIFLLVRILRETRSRVAVWYSAAIGVTLISSLYEVLAAALGIKEWIGSINSVTAALFSSLLAALAIAEHIREEHLQRLAVQAELAHTFEATPIGLFTLDLRGRFLSANPALLAMLSPNVLQHEGNSWQQYFAPGAWPKLHHMVRARTQDEIEVKGRPVLGFSGTRRFLVKATLANDKIEGSLQDITEKSRATEELYFLANHDSLTKVLNRRGIEQVVDSAIGKLSQGKSLAMAYLDLDRFKLINDLFGHGAGDEVLRQVCQRVKSLLPPEAEFGRVGGDEFAIVFPQTPIAPVSLMCRGIIDFVGAEPFRVGDKAFYVRGSIGLVEVGSGMGFNDAMSSADRACRQAKKANGSGLVMYEQGALAFELHETELKLMALLSTHSATSGMYLEMQPIMSLTAPHESLNFEVLLRMRDPDGQPIRTDRLISAAENAGRMGMIDRWVLSTTLAWFNTYHAQLKHTKFICINLSGASLNDEQFLQDVYTTLEQNLHLAGQLCLEITESVALHDLENTRRFVEKVRGYGVKVALDDFGAGYTSFSYLKEFKADLLKIDGSFIVNMNRHPANIAIVEAMVSLAKNLGMKVIAEWAEDNATVQTLVEIGVDYVQGFAVTRSQPPDKLLSAVSSASFIKNAELAQIVELIGAASTVPTPKRRMSDRPRAKIH